MELLIVGSILLCTLVGTVVGLKLLGLAARSRKFPEFAIGAGLFCYAALSQPALLAHQVLGDETSLGLRMGVALLRILAFYLTLLGLSLFTWRVFGVESLWRQALAAGLALAALISGGLSAWGTWLQLSSNAPMSLYLRIGMTPHYVIVFGWVSLESLRYYGLMKKRRAVGLADAIVTNRFLVWGAGEGVASLLVLALFAVMMTGEERSIADPSVAWLITLAGLLNALVWWLTFTPPAAYLRRVRGHAAAEVAEGG